MRGGRELLANVVASQIDFHARFGGVVPEIASRKHTEAIVGVVDEAMERAGEALGLDGPLPFAELDAIAVTLRRPGSSARWWSGVAYAKGLAMATGLPLVGVNHLEGHIFANVFADPRGRAAARGAAGLGRAHVARAHARVGRLPHAGRDARRRDRRGVRQGRQGARPGLSRRPDPLPARRDGRPGRHRLPARDDALAATTRSRCRASRPPCINHIRHEQEAGREIDVPDLAASFQQAVIDVQVSKAVRAVEETGATPFCLGGRCGGQPGAARGAGQRRSSRSACT